MTPIINFRPTFSQLPDLLGLTFTVAMMMLSPSANAAETTPASPPPKWCLLIHLGIEERVFCDSDMESWDNPPENAEVYNCKTLVSDGSKVVTLKGWIANIGGQLYRITVPIFKDKASCKKLGTSHSYAVDVIRAQSLGTTKGTVVLGQDTLDNSRTDMRTFRSECRTAKASIEETIFNQDFGERSVIHEIAFFDHYLNVRIRNNGSGGAHPTHDDRSAVYDVSALKLQRIAAKDFPKAFKAVKSEYAGEDESRRISFQCKPSELNDFNFSKQKLNYQFDFHIPPSDQSARGSTLDYCYEFSSGSGTKTDRAWADFIRRHPKLAPWLSATDYWIAPDLSTVAYIDKGKIVFRVGESKSKPLPIHLNKVVGWQWFDSTKISQEAIKELGLNAAK